MQFIVAVFPLFLMNEIEIKTQVDLKNYCTFHIGGKAKFLCVIENTNNLIEACSFCKAHNIKCKVIGLGANLLFDDLGFDGMIIVNKTNKIRFLKNSVLVDSGVNVTNLIMKCAIRNLCGIENLSGIPATVGGAITNNLGAFDCEFSSFVEWVEGYSVNDLTKKMRLHQKDCKFAYRSSLFKSGDFIITRAKLKLETDDCEKIKKRIFEIVNKKKSTQPLDCFSAGSVFKRGQIIPAKVIDELGLKGAKIGGAEISTKHAGFIVNTNLATSEDVKNLVALIQEKVISTHGEWLSSEIEFVPY